MIKTINLNNSNNNISAIEINVWIVILIILTVINTFIAINRTIFIIIELMKVNKNVCSDEVQ